MIRRLQLFVLALVLLLSGCQSLIAPTLPLTQQLFGEDDTALDLGATLPVDPEIRHGTLENGLTYYVKRNTEPANRAELWLVINAGSVLEDEDQLGLAHFLEHMLFKGTDRFPERSLIDFFETVGMTFGPDINAYTSFDETVYQLRFPTDDEEVVKTAFEVLEDWAAYATIDPEDVDAERPVIVEEERLRYQTAGGRLLTEQIYPVLLAGSHYGERLPIGDMNVIRNAPVEAIRRFYETWYRPDLMAVIAVGDFEPDHFVDLIEEHFANLPVPENPVPRPTYDVPDHQETRYLIASDPEYPVTEVGVYYKHAAQEGQTVGDYRELVVSSLFSYLINFRLDEISRQADSPFLYAYVSEANLVRPVDSIEISAQVQDEEILPGLDAILTEVERIRRHGFNQSELARAKDALHTAYRRLFNNRENWDSQSFAEEYVRSFLTGEPIPGISMELALVEALLPGIELAEVNQQIEALVGEENRTVVITAPEKADLPLPAEAELAAVIEAVEEKTIDPYVDAEVAGELMSAIPEPAPIIAESTIAELDITEIQLANGVRVIMKPTEFTQQVVFAGVSPGGASLVSDEDYLEATFIGGIVSESALGDYERTELNRLLTGKGVVVAPSIDGLTESVTGAAPPDELEPLFQLIYLYFTEPHADEAALDTLQDQIAAYLRNRDLTPSAAMEDALQRILYGDSVRFRTPTVEEVQAVDLDRALEIYQERFADADDFTFVFIGDFSVDVLKSFAQTYLGTLPVLEGKETWQDLVPEPPEGVIEEAVYKGQDPRSVAQLLFSGPVEPTVENALRLGALENMLNIRLDEELREERSGVYASGAFSALDEDPDPLYRVGISFVADPERVEELVDAIFEIAEDLQANGPSDELLTKAKAQMIRDREEELEQNFFWLNQLVEYALDAEKDPRAVLDLEEQVDALTAAELQQAAQDFLRQDRYIRVVLHPEEMRPTSG